MVKKDEVAKLTSVTQFQWLALLLDFIWIASQFRLHFLHDVVEDTQVTESDIELKFGKQVSILVTGLSKLDKVEFQDANEAQAENFRKMLLAMTQDVRVMLIKLSDRLHNMQNYSIIG